MTPTTFAASRPSSSSVVFFCSSLSSSFSRLLLLLSSFVALPLLSSCGPLPQPSPLLRFSASLALSPSSPSSSPPPPPPLRPSSSPSTFPPTRRASQLNLLLNIPRPSLLGASSIFSSLFPQQEACPYHRCRQPPHTEFSSSSSFSPYLSDAGRVGGREDSSSAKHVKETRLQSHSEDPERKTRRRKGTGSKLFSFSSLSSSLFFLALPSSFPLRPSPLSPTVSPSPSCSPSFSSSSSSSRLFQVRWIFPVANPNPPLLEVPSDLPVLPRVSRKKNSPPGRPPPSSSRSPSPPRPPSSSSSSPAGKARGVLAEEKKSQRRPLNGQHVEENSLCATQHQGGEEEEQETDGGNEDEEEGEEEGDCGFVSSPVGSSSADYCQVSHSQKRRGMRRKKSRRINAHIKLKKKAHQNIKEVGSAGGGGVLKTYSLLEQGEEDMKFWRAQGERAKKLEKELHLRRKEREEEEEEEAEKGAAGGGQAGGESVWRRESQVSEARHQQRRDREGGEHHQEGEEENEKTEPKTPLRNGGRREEGCVRTTSQTSLRASTDKRKPELLSYTGLIRSAREIKKKKKKGLFPGVSSRLWSGAAEHLGCSRQPCVPARPHSPFFSSCSSSSSCFVPSTATCLFAARPLLQSTSFSEPHLPFSRTRCMDTGNASGFFSERRRQELSSLSQLPRLSSDTHQDSSPQAHPTSSSTSSTRTSSSSLSSSSSPPSAAPREDRGESGACREECQAGVLLDHRRLGREMEMFLLSPPSSPPGLIGPVFLTRGLQVLENLKNLIRNHQKELGFQEVVTPSLAHEALWSRSGHWQRYRPNIWVVRGASEDSGVRTAETEKRMLQPRETESKDEEGEEGAVVEGLGGDEEQESKERSFYAPKREEEGEGVEFEEVETKERSEDAETSTLREDERREEDGDEDSDDEAEEGEQGLTLKPMSCPMHLEYILPFLLDSPLQLLRSSCMPPPSPPFPRKKTHSGSGVEAQAEESSQTSAPQATKAPVPSRLSSSSASSREGAGPGGVYGHLPLRLSEFGRVFRRERRSSLSGLLRLREFTQDDGHIICLYEDMKEEIVRHLRSTLQLYSTLGIRRSLVRLTLGGRAPSDAPSPTSSLECLETDEARRDQRSVLWKEAEQLLLEAAESCLAKDSLAAPLDYEEGGGAFYGPKLDISIPDAQGRFWQTGTIQVDLIQPRKLHRHLTRRHDRSLPPSSAFSCSRRIAVLHRASVGSLERFLALLLELHGGYLPLCLAPQKAAVCTVTVHQRAYATEVARRLQKCLLRNDPNERSEDAVLLDTRRVPLNAKIKELGMRLRIPLLFLVGPKEEEEKSITFIRSSLLRRSNKESRDEKYQGEKLSLVEEVLLPRLRDEAFCP